MYKRTEKSHELAWILFMRIVVARAVRYRSSLFGRSPHLINDTRDTHQLLSLMKRKEL